MKRKNEEQYAKTPFDMTPENTDERSLIQLLEVLVSAGRLRIDDIEHAWALVYDYS